MAGGRGISGKRTGEWWRSIWIYRFTRWTLAILFLVAGVIKLQDLDALAATIKTFGLLPRPFVGWAALGLPLVEILAAVGLIFDSRGALNVITGLLICFVLALTYGLWLGLDVDCGCYGPADPESRAVGTLRPALGRDLIMLLGIGYLYWWRWRERSGRTAVASAPSNDNGIEPGSVGSGRMA